ncbi:MAG: transcriptional regulator [Acidobacteriota bacterium]|nr:MAG: transcriptional regulator [Acidobacteriota bacterium]
MEGAENRLFFEFDEFRIDVGERLLFRESEQVAVAPKDFDLLMVLIENRGRTVTKEDLMDSVWQDTFVYEGNLYRHISTLRKLLEESHRDSKLITTVPKRGYRFDGEVREVFVAESALIAEERTQYRIAINEVTETAKTSRLALSFSTLAVATVIIGVAAFATIMGWRQLSPGSSAAAFVPNIKEHGTENAEAYELFVEGRQLWKTRATADLHNATIKLEQAIEKDPQFARAHAALADAYAFDFFDWVKAESVAETAARLDPTLAEPHATIGFIRTFWQWKPKEAESYFKRAVAIDPGYATAHQWYAMSLAARARTGLALAELRLALELDPTSTAINADMCQMLYFSRRYDLAIEQCRRTLELDPQFGNAHQYLYEIYTTLGLHEEAIDRYFIMEKLGLIPQDVLADSEDLRLAYASAGVRSFWERRTEILRRTPANAYRLGQYYARLGDNESALAAFSRAFETRDLDFIFFAIDPAAEALSKDPRYNDLTAKLIDMPTN